MERSRIMELARLGIQVELGVFLVEKEHMVSRKPPHPQMPFVIDRILFVVECSFYLQRRQIFKFGYMINNYKNKTYIHWTSKNGRKILKIVSFDINKIITS